MTALHTDEYRRFVHALRDLRERAGISQYDLADRLGVRQDFISKVEGGRRRLDVIEFLRIVKAIGGDPLEVLAAVKNPGTFGRTRVG